MNYRIAYLGNTMVNWCPELGTVLANDEVVDGVSERGGYPVVQKKMRQWCLRVSAYAQRLLDGLETVDWTDSLKETQRNWIGRSEGTEVHFKVKDSDVEFTIFTTRADTMFGVTFMVLAPESELVAQLTTEAQKAEVEAYLDRTKKRTERERIADRSVTGVFSGSYAINPFTGEAVPVWISDYVLQVTVQAPSWQCLLTIAVTMLLPNILTCLSFRWSKVVMSLKKVSMPKKESYATLRKQE